MGRLRKKAKRQTKRCLPLRGDLSLPQRVFPWELELLSGYLECRSESEVEHRDTRASSDESNSNRREGITASA